MGKDRDHIAAARVDPYTDEIIWVELPRDQITSPDGFIVYEMNGGAAVHSPTTMTTVSLEQHNTLPQILPKSRRSLF